MDEERTELTLSLATMSWSPQGGPPDPDEAPERVKQVDRLADWLAEHGDGRVLQIGWGKP